MHGTYNPYLVALSLGIAVLASYAALDLAARIRSIEISGRRSHLWLLGGAVAMGVGIWSIHFIGMLALRMPMAMGYDPWITGLSLLIAIGVAYFALYITATSTLTRERLALGGVLMGTGIAGMHYTGMAAMRIRPGIQYRSGLFLISICIAFGASWAALWIASTLDGTSQRREILKRCAAALVMGLAIAGMHYVGMSAAGFAEGSVSDVATGIGGMRGIRDISATMLVVAISAISLFGLVTTLVLSVLDARFDRLQHRANQSLEDANKRLRVLATIDTLTGLSNRGFFLECIERRIADAREHASPFSVMYMDLDGFKTINDSLGHGTGDELLQAFAQELQLRVRSQDLVARLGGDEFVILLNGLGQPREVTPIATAILERMQKDFVIRNMPLRVTASVGIATYPKDGDSVASLLKNADMAMYDAKQRGRNTFRFFNAAMSDAASRILAIYRGLGEALERDQFSLVFQPKFDGLRNSMVGAEALIRWTHPEMGMIAPMDFIPLAEQTGQIRQIADWVIAEVCRQMKVWERKGFPPIKVAINLSPEQLRQDRYAERVARMVADAGIKPQWIMFEITETVAMREPEMAGEVIRQFQRAGFDIAIDDFGTGYSSMAYLQQFRVKELKIDRFFTSSLDEREGQTIVSAIIALAHSLHMTVVAEGVETHAQLQQLKGMNCDGVQGYLMARPLPAVDFETFMREHAVLVPVEGTEAWRSLAQPVFA